MAPESASKRKAREIAEDDAGDSMVDRKLTKKKAREDKTKTREWNALDKANLEEKKRKSSKKTSGKTTGSIATSTCRPKIETSTSTSPFSASKTMRQIPPQQYLPNNHDNNIARRGIPATVQPGQPIINADALQQNSHLRSSKEDLGAITVQQQPPETSGVNTYDAGIVNVPRVQQNIPHPMNIPSQGCLSSSTLSSPIQQQSNSDRVNPMPQNSQQGLTNDLNNGNNAQQLHDDGSNTESTNDAANFPVGRFVCWIVLVIVSFIVIVNFYLPSKPLSNEVTDANITKDDNHTCYFYPGDMGKEEVCSENNGNMVPCPIGGVCSGGILIKCLNAFQDLSEAEDRCTLSKKYLPMTKVITEELAKDASAKCSLFTDPVDYDSLQTKYPEIIVERNLELIKALEYEGFRAHQDEEGRFYLNLPEDFVVLNLPLYCKFGEAASFLFEAIGYLLWKVTTFFLTNIWGFVQNYPKISVVVFVGFLIVCAVHNRGVKREKRERDTVLMREMAYTFLQTYSSSAHQILHVRDDCTNKLYPDSRKQRQILNNDIWPRVVTNLKYDTRVRKTTRMIDGNVRDMWQWTARAE